jgi:hypothetical protein
MGLRVGLPIPFREDILKNGAMIQQHSIQRAKSSFGRSRSKPAADQEQIFFLPSGLLGSFGRCLVLLSLHESRS